MSAKLCPLLMAAVITGRGPNEMAAMLCNGANIDPHATGCIGSTCAAWTTSLRAGDDVRDGWGRCAHFGGDRYPDPAGGTP